MRHYAAVGCLTCTTEYSQYGIDIDIEKLNIILKMKYPACIDLMKECYGYISTTEKMNENAALYVYVMSSL